MMSCLEMVKMQLGSFWGLSEFDDDFDLLASQAEQNVLRILEKSTVHFEGKGTLKTSVYPLNSIEYMLFLYEAARINLHTFSEI